MQVGAKVSSVGLGDDGREQRGGIEHDTVLAGSGGVGKSAVNAGVLPAEKQLNAAAFMHHQLTGVFRVDADHQALGHVVAGQAFGADDHPDAVAIPHDEDGGGLPEPTGGWIDGQSVGEFLVGAGGVVGQQQFGVGGEIGEGCKSFRSGLRGGLSRGA